VGRFPRGGAPRDKKKKNGGLVGPGLARGTVAGRRPPGRVGDPRLLADSLRGMRGRPWSLSVPAGGARRGVVGADAFVSAPWSVRANPCWEVVQLARYQLYPGGDVEQTGGPGAGRGDDGIRPHGG